MSSSSSSSSSGGGGAGGTTTSSSSTSTTTSEPVLDPSGYACSGAAPSLANDIIPIAAKSCVSGMGCHAAMDKAPGFYDQLVNRIAEQCTGIRLMVEPGQPEKSYLIHKLVGKNICTGQTMPKDEPLLPSAEIQLMYDWICTGAPNN